MNVRPARREDLPAMVELWIERCGFIQEIHVAEAQRRHGVARRLYRTAEQWLLDRGVDRIEVRIDADNPLSLGFFESEGFEPHVVTRIKRFDRRGD